MMRLLTYHLVGVFLVGVVCLQSEAVEWTDEFTGGFQQSWDFLAEDGSVNPPSHTEGNVVDDALEIKGKNADFPDFNEFSIGIVGLTSDPSLAFPESVQVTSTILPTTNHSLLGIEEMGNNDTFVIARTTGASGYLIALDLNSGSFDLVRSDGGDPSNIAPGLIVPDFDPNQTYVLRVTAEGDMIRGEIFDESMNLLLDAFARDTEYDSGFAGVGSAINNDEALGFDRTLVTGRFDNVMATDENIQPMQVFFPDVRLDERLPTATGLNAIEVRDIGDPEHIRGAISFLQDADPASRIEGTISKFDIDDPDAGGGGIVPGIPESILSDELFVDDDDFAQLLSGSFGISEDNAGEHTFNIQTDDGFVMRVFYIGENGGEEVLNPVPFTEVGAEGILSPTGEVASPHDPGNVQAVIDLAEGSYSYEMLWFEDGGGAFAEVSTVPGNFVADPGAANWMLLGAEGGLAFADGLGTGPTNVVEPLLGDYDGSGQVEQADLDLVLLNWGDSIADPAAIGWINDLPDGAVDQGELDGVLLNWGNSAAVAAGAVPEPTSCLLLLTALLLSSGVLRRKRR